MTPVGIVVALGSIFMAMIMDHGKPMTIVSIPSMILVFGGTFGVSMAGVNKHDLKPVRGAFRTAIKNKVSWHASDFNQHLLAAAKEARTMGLLALENGLPEAQVDPFVRSGVELITTTSDPERVRSVLDAEIIGMRARHRVGIKFFQDMGGFAPTIGILGTVIGLVRVLGDLSSPATLGPAIASAFTATLWGVMTRQHLLDPHIEQAEATFRRRGAAQGACHRGAPRRPRRTHRAAASRPPRPVPRSSRARRAG